MAVMRFVMIGGFLGAGKTTTIARLARAYQEQGLKVGIVTNDQAADLVDTHMLRSQGFNVGEVAGSCFCCNFNELTDTVARLAAAERPDIVLAEPVGSCTDIVATVAQPLMQMFADQFEVAPYGVILKPSHGLRILQNDPRAGFSPKAAYIFRKQLEEADFVIINRIDELPREDVDLLARLLGEQFPAVPLLRISARTGEGLAALVEFLEQRGAFGQRILDLDYDVYAEGEAELGWLNSALTVSGDAPWPLDDLLRSIVERLRLSLAAVNAETAHLKTIGLSDGAYGVANLISRDSPAELSLPSRAKPLHAEVIVNARVALAPEILQQHVQAAVKEACQDLMLRPEFRQTRSFRPGRPVPTFRYAKDDVQ